MGRFIEQAISNKFDRKSMNLLHYKNKFRVSIVWLTTHYIFDLVIILFIFTNSIFLAINDYSDTKNVTLRNRLINGSAIIFTIVFTIECMFKIITIGFIKHKNAYLRDTWNWIDFVVVITGLRALRTLRVLRPLRSINAIPSMRRLVRSLFSSLPELANVVVFLLFVFILFGILGVQQFSGVLYRRCRVNPTPESPGFWEKDLTQTRVCSPKANGLVHCGDSYCGSPEEFGISLYDDGVSDNPAIFYGIITFDNLYFGMLTIFQVITLEGWVDVMYNLMDGNQTGMAVIYFCLLVLFGSFFLLNLILAVIMETFNKIDHAQAEERKLEAAIQSQHTVERMKLTEEPFNSQCDSDRQNTSKPLNREDCFYEEHKKSQQIRSISELNNILLDADNPIESRANRNIIYKVFYRICNHNIFGAIIIGCIFGNTVVLAMDREPISQSEYLKLGKVVLIYRKK